jgi:plastocyanin
MRIQMAYAAAFTILPYLVIGCSDASRPTALSTPSRSVANATAGVNASGSQHLVNMSDACDPATFNAAAGPGTCVRQGGVTFAHFIDELTRNQSAGAWHFAPSTATASVGQTFLAVNRGGEVHTFTHVAAFGGGIIPPLNALSGNPVPAPECLALEPDDFVAPGNTYQEQIEGSGTQLFQCCIHPWMRMTVRAL